MYGITHSKQFIPKSVLDPHLLVTFFHPPPVRKYVKHHSDENEQVLSEDNKARGWVKFTNNSRRFKTRVPL